MMHLDNDNLIIFLANYPLFFEEKIKPNFLNFENSQKTLIFMKI